MTPTVIRWLCAEADGWSILDPDGLIEAGVDADLVNSLTDIFESDLSRGTSTIFVDGKPANALRGVNGLRLLTEVADKLGADTSKATQIGRGSRGDALKAAILATLESEATT